TAGATLSFLAARHWWRDAVRRRWGHRLAVVEEGVRRHGALALFWLRMAPVIPFPVLNPLMGLSAMPTATFFTASALGMLAGSAAWVYAGSALGGAQAWQDLLAPPLWLALATLGLLPWAAREVWRRRMVR
ncbi:MAG TPA: VTT domain-containing protein, partial [Rubrivivax sp.]|nr:VTT domain-containing protein [Rubrivivax sp.]